MAATKRRKMLKHKFRKYLRKKIKDQIERFLNRSIRRK